MPAQHAQIVRRVSLECLRAVRQNPTAKSALLENILQLQEHNLHLLARTVVQESILMLLQVIALIVLLGRFRVFEQHHAYYALAANTHLHLLLPFAKYAALESTHQPEATIALIVNPVSTQQWQGPRPCSHVFHVLWVSIRIKDLSVVEAVQQAII